METNIKEAMLLLFRILFEKTNNIHNALTMEELILEMQNKDHHFDPRKIKRDIEVLNEYHYHLAKKKNTDIDFDDDFEYKIKHTKSRPYRYYIENRRFSFGEIKVLEDTLRSLAFLSENHRYQLTEKLSRLLSNNDRKMLYSDFFEMSKNKSKQPKVEVFETIELLSKAIKQKQKINFNYQKSIKKADHKEMIDGYDLIVNNGQYYLLTYNFKYENIVFYRVDRISSVVITDTKVSSLTDHIKKEINNLNTSKFNMYGGKEVLCQLEFDPSILLQVKDKFGDIDDYITMTPTSMKLNIKVEVAPTFFSWLTTYQNKIKIISPFSLQNEYCEYLKSILSNY